MELDSPPRSITVYIVLAAILYALINAYSLLSPILLSFLLIVLITLAVNPIIARLRTWTGGRKRATGLVLVGVLAVCGLAVWATVVPLKEAATSLSEKWPAYWERLQKPLIKMEQQAVIAEEKLQQEVSAEIVEETPSEPERGKGKGAPDIAVSPQPDLSRSAEVEAEPEKGKGSLRASLVEMIQGVFGQVKGVALNTTEMLIVMATVFLV